MKVFITGASGFVGRAMIAWSLDHGDSVVALARSDKSADAAFSAANGRHIQVLRGDLSDPEIMAKGEWSQPRIAAATFALWLVVLILPALRSALPNWPTSRRVTVSTTSERVCHAGSRA